MFIPLTDFVAQHSQSRVASMLGCTQGYISQTISSNRVVYIRPINDYAAEAIEIRGYGRQRAERNPQEARRLQEIGRGLEQGS